MAYTPIRSTAEHVTADTSIDLESDQVVNETGTASGYSMNTSVQTLIC